MSTRTRRTVVKKVDKSENEEITSYVYFVPTGLDFNYPSVKPATTVKSRSRREAEEEDAAAQPAS